MLSYLLSSKIHHEKDIVWIRQRGIQIAKFFGFDSLAQTQFGTAISEIVRNTQRYATSGEVDFILRQGTEPAILARVHDKGQGISDLDAVLNGRYHSKTGMGHGIAGTRRLMDEFSIQSDSNGTEVLFGMHIPPKSAYQVNEAGVRTLVISLASMKPASEMAALEAQNQELLQLLNELSDRQDKIERLNRELAETNRGVVALYAELDEKAVALQRASDLKSSFVSNISHEFRTPLNAILSMTSFLERKLDGDLTDEQDKQVTFIRSAAEDLYEMVNDLLDLAKIESGKIDIDKSPFALKDTFEALRGMFRPLTGSAVELHIDTPEDTLLLFSDQRKISQILRNLISNALKFTEQGTVKVSAEKDDNQLRLFVKDSGIGIEPEHFETVFQEFRQLDSKLQRRHKGTGLGLPLARKFAQLLGGDLRLERSDSSGSLFTLTIPLGSIEKVDSVQECDPPQNPIRMYEEPLTSCEITPLVPGRALVVDDDDSFRYQMAKTLQSFGFEVEEAKNGAEALKQLGLSTADNQPQLICLDLAMPEVTGLEVLAALRKNPETEQIPVIINTSKHLNETERDLIRSQASAILIKDSLNDQLRIASIREALLKCGIKAGNIHETQN